MIPSELRVYGPLELYAAHFIDTTGVYPEVIEAILNSLGRTEEEFSVARLVFPSTINYVSERDFFVFPRMGQDGITRNIIADELHEAEFAIAVASQKTHSGKSGPENRLTQQSWRSQNETTKDSR